MKQCSKCAVTKPVSEYNKYSRMADGLQVYCRDCQKSHYRGNAERHKVNVALRREENRAELRKKIREILSSGCVDCGILDIRVLEFDHLPEHAKKYNISDIVRNSLSIKTLTDEIEKCEVVCCNDHAIRTANRRGTDWRLPS